MSETLHKNPSEKSDASRCCSAYLVFWVGIWALLLFHLSGEWWNNPQYGYGLLVPFLCGWLLWENRFDLARAFEGAETARSHSIWVYFFLGCGAMMLFPIELLRQVSPQLRSIGIGGAIFCLGITHWSLRCLGLKRIPAMAKGVAFLFVTSIPWPVSVELWVTQSLMRGIASITADLLNLIGFLAVSRGNLIELSQGMVSIDEACSGVRSLQSCIMSTVALSLFFRLSFFRALILGAAALSLALLGNLVRTIILTVLAATQGLSSIETFHDPAGWGILIGVTLILYFLADRWGLRSNPEKLERFPEIDWGRLPRAGWILMVGLGSLVAAHLWYGPSDAFVSKDPHPFLQVKSQSELHLETVPVPSGVLGVLKPNQGAYYRGQSRIYGEISVYNFYWLPGSLKLQSYFHRPDICMTGVGWEMDEAVEQIRVNLDGRSTLWYVFSFKREGQHVIQAWGVWRDGAEQELSFSSGWKSLFGQLWHYKNLIQQGRRRPDAQIASVVMDARHADREVLVQIIQQVFTARNENHS